MMAKQSSRQTVFLRSHILRAVSLVVLCHIVSICTIDSPKTIYHCPLDQDGLSRLWNENCYWSTSYAEAREKFISLGNRLREQVLLAKSRNYNDVLGILDIQSLSYDICREDYPNYVKSLEANGILSPQTVLPETDTVDALLLTLRIPENDSNTKNVNIIHSSGTHGIEGYLGSAVQVRFLHELFLHYEEKLVSNQQPTYIPSPNDRVRKILLIHAVNPYGMRHHRRTNENNVDLNRNVLSEKMWRDVRKRDPNFVGYVDMDSTLNPFETVNENGKLFSWVDAAKEGGFEGDVTKLSKQDKKAKSTIYESKHSLPQHSSSDILKEQTYGINEWLNEKKNILQVTKIAIAAIGSLGFTNAKRGLVASQYHKPPGLAYGGGAHSENMWENSIFAVQHAITEFAGLRFDSTFSTTVWIDVHTGLGKYGDYSILTKGGPSSDTASEYSEEYAWRFKFRLLLEKSQMGLGKSSEKSVSEGYDEAKGFITDSVLCPDPYCYSMTQEFGTRPGVGVAVALILENKGHHAVGRKYSHLTSWAFYPQRLSWRRKALRGGMELLHAGIEF